nr:ribonuclease [Gemmatimonadales bacterium]
MKREILINGSQRETRVAILEDDRLVELLVDRPDHRRTVGDIYLGRVEAVLPGIQAAFVDIGQEKSAFLHASDLLEPDEDEEPEEEAEDEVEAEQSEAVEAPPGDEAAADRKAGWRGRDRRRRGRGNGAAATERTAAAEGRQRE